MTDEQLLAGLRRGDATAFRQLVEKHQHKVLNICYRFVHDREDAEDLAQETFLQVHRSIRKFRGQASLSTWIHRIAVSKSLDFLRKHKRQKRLGKVATAGQEEDIIDRAGVTDETPETVLEQQERAGVLKTALDSLPKQQRVAFVLSKYDGVSYQEIASMLKTTLPAVESLIHRAKKNLQKKLRKYYTENL